jgi:hypothetical protein
MGWNMTKRIFIAHKKDLENETIDLMTTDVKNIFGTSFVTCGRDDYNKRALLCGGWDGWARSVAQILDPVSREPRYHMIVIPLEKIDVMNGSILVGKGTASILKYSKNAGREIIGFCDNEKYAITGAKTIDAEDWKAGWMLMIGDVIS